MVTRSFRITPRSSPARSGVAAVGVALGSVGASAQGLSSEEALLPPEARGRAWWQLEPADPLVDDVGGPLSRSLRVPRQNLRFGSGFNEVFRVPVAGGADLFARRSNGITAIFPESEYLPTPFGQFPVVPPGTQFVIGEPPAWLLAHLGVAGVRGGEIALGRDRSAYNAVDGSIQSRRDQAAQGLIRLERVRPIDGRLTPEARPPTPQEVDMIERAKARRLSGSTGAAATPDLLRRAARAELTDERGPAPADPQRPDPARP